MTTVTLRIRFAGPHVTVQDMGRPGLARFGVPQSGPMDRLAHQAAQRALGNPPEMPGIEVSRGGVQLDCLSGAVSFALAGGGFILDHAGQRGGSWTVAALHAGQSLTIRPGPWGSWCHLAFAGALDVPRWLGHAATHAASGLGGGRLVTGQILTLTGAALRPGRHGPIPCPVLARPRARLPVTLGPQERFFTPEAVAALHSGPWQLTAAGDRMGVRLRGPDLTPAARLDMPSEPVPRGAIQVAGDGVATVLLADHQTTGGYPKIACVLDHALDGFAQLRPGDRLAFHAVTPEAAVARARQHAAAVARYLATLDR